MEHIGKVIEMTLNNTGTSELNSNGLKICPECGGKKEVLIEILGIKRKVPCLCRCESAEMDRLRRIEEQERRMHKLENLRKYSLMGKRFRECTFENFKTDDKNKEMYRLGTRYCENWQEIRKENAGLLLYGPPGVGKTFLAFCIANRLLDNMIPVIAISSIGLLGKIKESYNYWGNEGKIEIISSLKNASLLVLDDLGAENNTTWAKEKIYEIIDSRCSDKKPCIITTNLTREGLKEKLTGDDGIARIYDRITEMCCPVAVAGGSRRADIARTKEKIIRKMMMK